MVLAIYMGVQCHFISFSSSSGIHLYLIFSATVTLFHVMDFRLLFLFSTLGKVEHVVQNLAPPPIPVTRYIKE